MVIIRGVIQSISSSKTKRITQRKVFAFLILTIKDEDERLYSVLIPDKIFRKLGFIPKVGHEVELEGYRSEPRYALVDYEVSRVKWLKRIG
ncbi:MAG: hypothetical protein ACFE7E_00375 [Candidatus Hodarchaeota archaeon]